MKTKLLLVFAFLTFQISFAETFLNPIAPVLQPLSYCDPNNDGYGTFDLDSQTTIIVAAQSGSASDYTVTYHETPDDAENGVAAVAGSYNNITAWSQVIYYRVTQISTNAYANDSFTLIVNPIPYISNAPDLWQCDYNGNGVETFDLTPLIVQILGVMNPATATVTFHSSLTSAEAGVSPLAPINAFTGANGQMIYARLTNNATGCYDVTSFQLHVEPLPLAMSSYPDYALCDSNTPTGFATFDLNSRIDSILMGQTGVTVAFYNTQADALNGSNAVPNTFVNTSNPQTLWIRLTNQFMGCFTISTMNIRVSPLPNLIPLTTDYNVCDVNQDGIATFDLTPLIGLLNGSGYTITFHETLTDAMVSGTTINNPSSYTNIQPFTQVIYVKGTDNVTGCFKIVPVQVNITSPPIAPVSLSNIQVCDADASPSDGTTTINLTQRTSDILAQQSLPASNYSVTYYNSQLNAQAGLSPIIPANNYIGTNGQVIWCRVELNSTNCYAVGSFNLVVNSQPFAIGPQVYSSCDNYNDYYDGLGILNLTQFASSILSGQNPATHQIKYYTTQMDAILGTNQISLSSAQSYATASTVIWVTVTNASGCYGLTSININFTASPNPIISTVGGRNTICVDYVTNNVMQSLTLNSGVINPSAYTFEWFEAGNPSVVIGTASTYSVDTPSANGATRTYVVRARSNGPLGCEMVSASFAVLQSGPATITSEPGYTIANLSGVQSITVAISGYGTYEYSLDNGAHQASNVFNNVALGTHQIHVWDLEGDCGELLINDVAINESQVPAPIGVSSQSFAPGATLANVVVNGTDVQWYASANNKNNLSILSTPLPLSTVLVDGTTYYATQTVGGIESTAYLPVTVHIILGVGDNEILPIQFGPNPVKNSLTMQSAVVLKSITVYTMLGQKVFEQDYNDTDITIDLSKLAAGNYVLKAKGETGQKTIRIIKE